MSAIGFAYIHIAFALTHLLLTERLVKVHNTYRAAGYEVLKNVLSYTTLNWLATCWNTGLAIGYAFANLYS